MTPWNSGLLPLKPDPRDKKFSKVVFAAPQLPIFPQTLNRPRLKPKDQGSSLSCTKQTTAGASEYQDGVELSAAWGWSRVCKRFGNYVQNGSDPRTAMKVSIEEGELPQSLAEYSFPKDDTQVIGNWNNWADHKDHAEPYRKAAYVKIPKVGDWFDSVRYALFTGKEQNQVVMAFGTWKCNWNQAWIPLEDSSLCGWHAYQFIDWIHKDGVPYLVARNSYGEGFGDGGYQYFPREVINREFAVGGTGLYVFVDLTPEQIALAKEETILGKIQRAIISLWWMLSQTFGLR